jgi:hypothetical protein
VERLKARLAQLEQHNDLVTESSAESHQGKSATHAVNLSSGKNRIGQGSTSESYTPHIRYTKLNFKVVCPKSISNNLFTCTSLCCLHHFWLFRLTHSMLLDPP